MNKLTSSKNKASNLNYHLQRWLHVARKHRVEELRIKADLFNLKKYAIVEKIVTTKIKAKFRRRQ